MAARKPAMIGMRHWWVAALLFPLAALADCWQPVPEASDVRFAATQAGAPIEGTFRRFSGRICLDAMEPEHSRIEVAIDTASVDMGLPEFDAEMRGADFFDSARWPLARFTSTGMRTLGNGRFAVTGQFTLRDRTRDVSVTFTLDGDDGTRTLQGQLTLQRLDFDIGIGQWRDTRWVGNDVELRFHVALQPEQGTGAGAPVP